jgi:hypothetical protein
MAAIWSSAIRPLSRSVAVLPSNALSILSVMREAEGTRRANAKFVSCCDLSFWRMPIGWQLPIG